MMSYEKDTAVKVAWKYYNEGLTQTEIATALNLSRMKVIKYLEIAKKNHIIQFKIDLEQVSDKDLQTKLIEEFGLDDVYIVPSANDHSLDNVTIAAANYIEDRITSDTMINIGYGETVSRTLGRLKISTKYKVTFVSLSGGVKFYMPTAIDQASDYYTTNPNYNHYILPSPLMVSAAALAENLVNEQSIKDILEMIPYSNFTVIGVGALNQQATLVKEGLLSIREMEILKSHGAVGDLLSQFYDINGDVLDLSLHNRLVSTEIQLLKSLHNVVAVACGVEKKEAIIGALKGGYIDILITDENVARSLLE